MRAMAILLAVVMVSGVARAGVTGTMTAEEQKVLVPLVTIDDGVSWYPGTWGWKTWSGVVLGTATILFIIDVGNIQDKADHQLFGGDDDEEATTSSGQPENPEMPSVASGGNTVIIQNVGNGTVVYTTTASETAALELRPDITQLTAEVYAAMDFQPREAAAFICQR